MIIRSLPASLAKRTSVLSRFPFKRSLFLSLLTAAAVVAIAGCGQQLYKFPQYNFAGRPIPPSNLANRVLVSFTTGTSGVLQILDGNRDLRNNVQNTITQFTISGYSGNNPTTIINFPDELKGYVYSNVSPYAMTLINYAKESSGGAVATLNSQSASQATASDGVHIAAALEGPGQFYLSDATLGGTYTLNLPNVYKVAVNQGDSIVLAMVRNSNTLYRAVKINLNSAPPPGAVDCQPTILPVYCVVPVPGTYDRPIGASFSLDGSTAYILNCGTECGGGGNGGAGVSFIPEAALEVNNVPTATPYPAVVTKTIPVPSGVTTALPVGTLLYVAGQQQQPDGLFTGFFTSIDLNAGTVAPPVSIADGYHSKLLVADDSTLWIAAQNCAVGERQKLFAAGNTTQAANYNCLTRVVLGSNGAASSASIIPAVSQAAGATVTVPYPNTNQDPYYYGSLTGLCWVQGLHKVYTAYGGQVHAFRTADGSEINNFYITVQGNALDVAYMDATDNTSN